MLAVDPTPEQLDERRAAAADLADQVGIEQAHPAEHREAVKAGFPSVAKGDLVPIGDWTFEVAVASRAGMLVLIPLRPRPGRATKRRRLAAAAIVERRQGEERARTPRTASSP